MISGDNWIYAAVSIWIALAVGIISLRKNRRMSLFEAMTTSWIVALGCTVIATPLSIFLNNGSTGNVWGDSLVNFLAERGFPLTLSVVIGQLYVELLDKVVVILLIYLMVFLYIYPVLAKFYNTIRNTFVNAFLMSVRHLPYTLLMVLVTVMPFVLFFTGSAQVQSIELGLSMLLGISGIAFINSWFLVRIFDNYIPKEEVPEEEKQDSMEGEH